MLVVLRPRALMSGGKKRLSPSLSPFLGTAEHSMHPAPMTQRPPSRRDNYKEAILAAISLSTRRQRETRIDTEQGSLSRSVYLLRRTIPTVACVIPAPQETGEL